MMKLRLRNAETKKTIKIQLPNNSTVQQLKETLLSQQQQHLSPTCSVRLSLNQNDEIHASSPHDSLPSLGITSGDLIYFSLFPIPSNNNNNESSYVPLGMDSENKGNPNPELPKQGVQSEVSGLSVPGQDGSYYVVCDDEIRETEESRDLGGVLVDMEIDPTAVDVEGYKFSESCFLRRVLREESCAIGVDGSGCDDKLLVIAIHAVMLESGFVEFDSATGFCVDRFNLPKEWPSLAFTMSLRYTIPELLGMESGVQSVVLKLQSLGHFVNVYGSLNSGGLEVRRVCLNKEEFGPILRSVWDRGDRNTCMNEDSGSSRLFLESQVFEFWKIVKDRLALPLLIDLCAVTDMPLPACLMRLPTELKLKILELLPGVDVAKMACVCSEMRYLSSNNDLWRQKFTEEFGGVAKRETTNWKGVFRHEWACKKQKREMNCFRIRSRTNDGRRFYYPLIWRDPNPLGHPFHIIGGEHDLVPGHGIRTRFGQPGRALPWIRH